MHHLVSKVSIFTSAIFKNMGSFRLVMYLSSSYFTVSQLYTKKNFEYKRIFNFDCQT